MTEPEERSWRSIVNAGVASGRSTLAEVARWKSVEFNVLRLLAAGLAVSVPIAIGDLAGDLAAGMVAALGALLMSSSGHNGSLRHRVIDLANTLVIGCIAVAVGAWSSGLSAVASSTVIVVGSIIAAIFGGLSPLAAKITTLSIVFGIIGASLGPHTTTTMLVKYAALGGIGAGALALLAFGIGHLLGLREPPGPARVPPADRIRAWSAKLRTLQGWQYVLRLGSSLIVAEILAHHLRGTHSYWIVLTVALVVQRDHNAALTHSLQRGLGTAIGVFLGALFLVSIPTWLLVVTIGMIGAARPYLRAANYTAYAMVMTPLVAVFTGLGAPMTADILRERLVDTVIGCVISVTVGLAAWRWVHAPRR
ncbi:FUSC family protein [Nocardia camponoti]|uniref:Integral membrane bound transporter domain-containing protein n=1 Tax=Nocardia camponoti TaxID=1616106 RepID=A0A917VDG3_9NOCA|nr:FUSC family protein [Nocardia camponoti]GGK65223.1 hypothetical protein GCM10011591_41850 [Nocardia camponoti]